MENTFEIVETSSSSEESEIEQDEITHPTKFLNEFPMNEYEKNRNELSGLKLRIKPGVPFHRL